RRWQVPTEVDALLGREEVVVLADLLVRDAVGGVHEAPGAEVDLIRRALRDQRGGALAAELVGALRRAHLRDRAGGEFLVLVQTQDAVGSRLRARAREDVFPDRV